MKREDLPTLFAGIGGSTQAKAELRTSLERLALALNGLDPWLTDNLITFGKNLSFLGDKALTDAVIRHAQHEYDKAIIWRTHILTWAGKNALKVDGDFVECGTHWGYSVGVMCEYLRFADTGKHYWCYDLFEGAAYDLGGKSNETPLETVQSRFSEMPYVKFIKGSVPKSFLQGAPSKVAFLHLDLNSADAERGALEYLLPRMSKGAMVVLDDYGWSHYKAQKLVADEIFSAWGIPIAELPTGQGLAIV